MYGRLPGNVFDQRPGCSVFSQEEVHPEGASLADDARQPQLGAHGRCQALRNCQAKASSLHLAARLQETFEGLEDAVDVLGWDAGPGIDNGHAEAATVTLLAGEQHGAALDVVLHRVRQEVDDDLQEPLLVGHHADMVAHG